MDKPFLDKRATDQLNLTVLRRVDPDTEQVLATAGHVALYDFDKGNKAWTRKDVEGSLFLLKRQTQPRFKIIILNKKSQDNFVENVLGGFQFEVATPYVLYRNKLDEVIGIWFYDEAECAMVAGLLQRITSAYPGDTSSEPQLPQVSAYETKMQLPAQIPTLPAEPYPLSAQEGDSAFWDRPISAGSSVPAAENRAKHMQPAMQDPSQAGPSSAASHATHGRGSLATPFADAAEQPLTDWSSSSAGAGPVQVQHSSRSVTNLTPVSSSSAVIIFAPQENGVSMFQKLAHGQQGATAQQDNNDSPPRVLSTSGAAGNSPSLHGPGPIGDAQQQNPLSALFANMKVSNSSTPTAQTPPPHLRAPSGSLPTHSSTPTFIPPPHLKAPSGALSGPHQQPQAQPSNPLLAKTPSGSVPASQHQAAANSPALLTPSFLHQRSMPKEPANPSQQQQAESESLRQVLARAASKGLSQSESPGNVQPQAISTSSPQARASSVRDRVRQVMIELANSDTFIDLIVQQLQTKDLL